MPRRITCSIVGALAAASLAAPVAVQAASPARVSVRVEAPGRTLVDATLTTTRTKVVKDGDATHSCAGTSAAGALDQATGGRWTASWFDGLGYAVDSIGGVRPSSTSQYWTLWVNGRSSATGACDTQLQAGDQVLEFLCTSMPDFSSCTNLPLALEATRARDGKAHVKVVLLKGDGTSTPVAGATVKGGKQPVRTGAAGTAVVALPDGESALRATHAGDVASARLHCDSGGRFVFCGSRDTTRPLVTLLGITDGVTFTARTAPRVLHGLASDASGVDVTLRLTRTQAGRCTRFDADRGAFRPCARAPRAPFEAGDRTRWSYLLPAKLGPGRYKLDVIATDGAGNRRALHASFRVAAGA